MRVTVLPGQWLFGSLIVDADEKLGGCGITLGGDFPDSFLLCGAELVVEGCVAHAEVSIIVSMRLDTNHC